MGKRITVSSQTRGWLLTHLAMGTVNYWFAFIADGLSALFFLTWNFFVPHARFENVLLSFGGGYLIWGLTEYIVHRWLYHQPTGIFGEGHGIHHVEAEKLIAMPWFVTTITVFGLWYLFSLSLGATYFAGCLSGWLVGFVIYSLVHHSHHHWNIHNGWIRKLKAYHRIHHHFPEYNYGVTMRFWDSAFGTRYRKVALRSLAADESVLDGEAEAELVPMATVRESYLTLES